MEISSSPAFYNKSETLWGKGDEAGSQGVVQWQIKQHEPDAESLRHEEEAQKNVAAVWGTININGNIVTIDENGATESPIWLDIDWDIDGAQARADAIMQKYGGILQKGADAEIVDYNNIKSDFTEFWGKVLGDEELFSMLFDGADIADASEDFTRFLTSVYEENAPSGE